MKGRWMKKVFLMFCCIVLCLCFFSVYAVLAEGEEATGVTQENISATDWKQELTSDRQQIKEQRDEVKQNAQEAKGEEKQLRDQIKAAMDSGDMETARKLKEQLRSTHQENVQQMQQDKQDIKISMDDFKGDVKEARQEGNLPPRLDRDNNPPGPQGGPRGGGGRR